MKFASPVCTAGCYESPPARGAWIEIAVVAFSYAMSLSPPARGAWIEMPPEDEGELMKMSPPARGAWIEIARI